MARGPEQSQLPVEEFELKLPQVDTQGLPIATVLPVSGQGGVDDAFNFDHLSGEDAWHRSLIYPA